MSFDEEHWIMKKIQDLLVFPDLPKHLTIKNWIFENLDSLQTLSSTIHYMTIDTTISHAISEAYNFKIDDYWFPWKCKEYMDKLLFPIETKMKDRQNKTFLFCFYTIAGILCVAYFISEILSWF